jgi:hypothetical protein
MSSTCTRVNCPVCESTGTFIMDHNLDINRFICLSCNVSLSAASWEGELDEESEAAFAEAQRRCYLRKVADLIQVYRASRREMSDDGQGYRALKLANQLYRESDEVCIVHFCSWGRVTGTS